MMRYKQIDFSRFSSMKIGPIVDVVLIDEYDYPDDRVLIGLANNILVSNTPPPLMMLSKKFDYIHVEDNMLVIGAATPTGKIVSFCKKNNIADFEFTSRLPGTLGGMIKMNAGLKEYETFNNLISVTCKDNVLKKEQITFGYRYTDISEVVFEARFTCKEGFSSEKLDIFKKMRSNQPKEASAGSCFKNPVNDYAGRLIEEVELKGARVGDMAFSEVHANFLVNFGKGTFDDAKKLIDMAEQRVLEKFNIVLEKEIIII